MSERERHHRFRSPAGLSVDEVLEEYQANYPKHGNSLDLLNQSMLLIQAGHYREAMELASRVMPISPNPEPLPDQVNKSQAQAAFLSANERARPLFEQAALEIEGVVEGSQTMAAYWRSMELLKDDPSW